jgi:hypothetical protein
MGQLTGYTARAYGSTQFTGDWRGLRDEYIRMAQDADAEIAAKDEEITSRNKLIRKLYHMLRSSSRELTTALVSEIERALP